MSADPPIPTREGLLQVNLNFDSKPQLVLIIKKPNVVMAALKTELLTS